MPHTHHTHHTHPAHLATNNKFVVVVFFRRVSLFFRLRFFFSSCFNVFYSAFAAIISSKTAMEEAPASGLGRRPDSSYILIWAPRLGIIRASFSFSSAADASHITHTHIYFSKLQLFLHISTPTLNSDNPVKYGRAQ